MTASDPGDHLSQPILNDHDIMKPGLARSGWDDKSEFTDGRDKFMEANEDLVISLGEIAYVLRALQEEAAELSEEEFELPEAFFPAGQQTYVFNDISPYFGIRLTLDHEVKDQSMFDYFVHPVSSIFYERPNPLDDEDVYESYMLLGLVDHLDPRGEDEFDPPFALAISKDCRRAMIVSRVSDAELARRRGENEMDHLEATVRSVGAWALRRHLDDLRREALADIRRGLRDPQLSGKGAAILVRLLGSDVVTSLSASESELLMVGEDPDGGHEFMLKTISLDDIPTEDLLAAQAMLGRAEAYDA